MAMIRSTHEYRVRWTESDGREAQATVSFLAMADGFAKGKPDAKIDVREVTYGEWVPVVAVTEKSGERDG